MGYACLIYLILAFTVFLILFTHALYLIDKYSNVFDYMFWGYFWIHHFVGGSVIPDVFFFLSPGRKICLASLKKLKLHNNYEY